MSKTSDVLIIAEARRLMAAAGGAAPSLPAIAAAVGVRPASLYKRFADRDALFRAVGVAVADECADRAIAERVPGEARKNLRRMALALLAVARTHPWELGLAWAGPAPAWERLRRAALEDVASLVGAKKATGWSRWYLATVQGLAVLAVAGTLGADAEMDGAVAEVLDRVIEGM